MAVLGEGDELPGTQSPRLVSINYAVTRGPTLSCYTQDLDGNIADEATRGHFGERRPGERRLLVWLVMKHEDQGR